MAWTRQPVLVTTLKKLLTLRARTERLNLMLHVQRLEAQAQMSGANPELLERLRKLRLKALSFALDEESNR